jgi:hypothetical protein
MPSSPISGRTSRANRGSVAVLANDALYSQRINEQRRPARMSKQCCHGNGHAYCCSECIRDYEELMGWFSTRRY